MGKTFPHPLKGELTAPADKFYAAVELSPFGNELLFEFAKKCAKEDNVSLNQFIVLAVAEKVSALKTSEFFAERIARARPERLEKILAKTPDHPPVPVDELHAGWRGVAKNRRRGRANENRWLAA